MNKINNKKVIFILFIAILFIIFLNGKVCAADSIFSLDKEILAKCKTDEELQEAFNKNVLDTINSIK